MTRLLLPFEHDSHVTHSPADAVLVSALKRLPRRVQQVVLLNRLDQLDIAQIAERLDLSLHAIEQHLLQALRACLTSSDHENHTAAYWYVHLQSPRATTCERIDFRRWLDASPQHLQAFRETELRWRELSTPASQLGASGWHRHARAAFTLGGCSLVLSLGIAAALALGLLA